MGNCRWDTTMGRDELRQSEIEQELEALYKKVARVDSLGDIKRIEQGSKKPTKPEEGLELQHQSEESLFQAREKRTFRIYSIIPALGFITLSFVIVAILVWPKIYRYESIDSGGRTYSVRINSLTGKSMYFDGREWLRFPIPANFAKKVSESQNDQPTKVQPTRVDTIKGRNEGLTVHTPSKNKKNWNYSVQVKAYPEASNREAIAFVEYLKTGHPDVHMEKIHLPGRGIWYRILIGYFMTAEEASDYMKKKRIVDAYPDSYVQSHSE
jgi:hypothetical protein